MSIDVATESLKTLAKAAQTLNGGPVHVSTMHRWRMRGVRGVKLESVLRGGIWHTSDQAIARFFVATTAAADREPAPTRTTARRKRDIDDAEAELSSAGI